VKELGKISVSSLRKNNDNPVEIGQFAADQIAEPGGRDVKTSHLLCTVLSENSQPRLQALHGAPEFRD